ncbi:AraC family transcriptional regulator [Paenibacillus radicis (ex Gao et al. 2016)]|uniref:AraC family transcriptional regulator n=1 Tax=Paenibacillus radicis (ex Gao et al. 2016) TaxID=1737354 RepID=A0A917HKJ2_9BACL|nr:helix-turn-helix domain-containing protein [Paenibacillus radicis (ex Gao et al. 2016)]GGG81540.1 AraC family transcriptional regulator [Paenibacillus radicis (ex Gao et al. 2016)]
MEQIKIISQALLEIEKQLYDRKLTPDSLAKQFYTNVSDLQKTFQIITGMTIGEYIRNRRLSNAGISLKTKNLSILETALNMGYETPEAFSKAFKRFHGVSPKDVRNQSTSQIINYFGPMHIKFSIESSAPLLAITEYYPTMYFVGKTISVSNDKSVYLKDIENFWHQETMKGTLSQLEKKYAATSFVGISLAGDTDRFTYGVGIVTTDQVEEMNEFEVVKFPPRNWVKFEVNGMTDEDFSQTRNRVLSEWLLTSDQSISLLPEIEYYPITEAAAPEIWFPNLE